MQFFKKFIKFMKKVIPPKTKNHRQFNQMNLKIQYSLKLGRMAKMANAHMGERP